MPSLPRLQYESTAILAGAGISIPSGIASGQIFNQVLLPRLVPCDLAPGDRRSRPLREPAVARRRAVRGNIRFEQLVDIIRRFADPELLLMHYLEISWIPTTLHQLLADAIARGSLVMTTNLDLLIESAYRTAWGRTPAQIITPEEWRGFDPRTPSLLKLHGTIRREGYLAGLDHGPRERFAALSDRAIETFKVTLDSIGSLVPSQQGTAAQFLLPPHVLDVLQSALAGRDLVIIGYSGSDDFDVMPSLRLVTEQCRRVVWIEHRGGVPLAVHRRGKLIVVRGPTLAALGELIGETPPEVVCPLDARQALEKFCEAWSREIELDEHQRFLISGSVLNCMGMLSHSLSTWEVGLEEVSTREPSTAAKFYLLLGDAYVAERTWGFAEEVYAEAIIRTERSRELVPHARSLLGYAFVLAIGSRILGNERAWDHACKLLGQLFGVAGTEPELSECEVRTAMTVSTLARLAGENTVARCTVYSDRLSLLRHYQDWAVLQTNKVLRAEYLAELSLTEFEFRKSTDFELHRSECVSLCSSLHLPLVRATFTLELGDLIGRMDRNRARALYAEAERLFRGAGYPVGVAEAILGRVVMAMADGDATDESALEEARDTFADEGMQWNLRVVSELSRAAQDLDCDTREAVVRNYYRTVHTHWRELMGKAGWLTSKSFAAQSETGGGHE